MKNTILKKAEFFCTLFLNSFIKFITILGGRTVATLVVALLVTIFSVIVIDQWISSISQENTEIINLKASVLNLHKLKANLYKAEGAQRGYLLTGRNVFVFPYNKSLEDARKNMVVIEKDLLSASDLDGQNKKLDWVKNISAGIEAKSLEMNMTIQLIAKGKSEEAMVVMNMDQGMHEMTKIMNYSDALADILNAKIRKKIDAREKTILNARLTLLTGALIIILLMVLVIKQLLAEIVIKNELQLRLGKENENYELKTQQQTKLLRSLALDYQADAERERQKLSRELHDELGSIFTATKMDIAWSMKKLKASGPEDVVQEITDKLKKTSRYIDQGIQYQRHIVQELHPAMLSTFGFWPALTSLIKDAAERNQWALTLNLPDHDLKLNETISLIAYRVVQETLNNANKYANATAISVHMIADEKYLKLELEDNGVGVDINALDKSTHGLSGMRHRVLAIGGHFEILSELGHGLLTRALIPLDLALI